MYQSRSIRFKLISYPCKLHRSSFLVQCRTSSVGHLPPAEAHKPIPILPINSWWVLRKKLHKRSYPELPRVLVAWPTAAAGTTLYPSTQLRQINSKQSSSNTVVYHSFNESILFFTCTDPILHFYKQSLLCAMKCTKNFNRLSAFHSCLLTSRTRRENI